MPNIPITTTLDDSAVDRLVQSLNMLDVRGKAAFTSLGNSAQIAELKVLKLAAATQLAEAKLGISTVGLPQAQQDVAAIAGAQAMLAAQNVKSISTLSQWGSTLQKTGTQLRQTGMNISMGLTLPILALGGVSVASAAKFETAMTQIFSQAGATREEVASITPKVLEMGKSTEQGPVKLAQAMFEIESVGFRGASALEVLRVAAMGATTGQADLTKVTIAMTGAMVSGIEGTESALGTMATINSIVGTSRMHMDEFASSLSSGILPVANNLGLTLSDVGGALGALSDMGVPVQEASTRLRTTLGLIAAPGNQARNVLEDVGFSHDELAEKMRTGGLVGMIELLREKLAGYSDTARFAILSGAFGGARSGSVLQTLMSDSGFKLLQEKQGLIGATGGIQPFVDAYIEQTKTLEFRWNRFVSNFQVNAIRLGNALAPAATMLMDTIGPAIEFIVDKFTALDPKFQRLIIGAVALVAVLGPVLVFVGAMASAAGIVLAPIGALIGGWFGVAAAAMAAFVAENLALLGIPILVMAAVAAIALLIYKWEEFKDAFEGLNKKNLVIGAIVFPFAPMLGALLMFRGKWEEIFHSLPRPVQEAMAQVLNPVINVVNTIIEWMNKLRFIVAIPFAGLMASIAMFNAISNAARAYLTGLIGIYSTAAQTIASVWGRALSLMPGFMSTAMNSVANIFKSFLDKMLDYLPGWLQKIGGAFGWIADKAGQVFGFINDSIPEIPTIGNLKPENTFGGRGVSEERRGIQAAEEQRRKDWIATMQFFSGFQIPDMGSFPGFDDSGGMGYDPDSGDTADKLNKTEWGLIRLAEAFKIFNAQTGSESIDAFKAWLDLQERIVEAQAAQNVRLEQAQNPMLAFVMALGAIRAHILEANITIEQFLRNDVFMPALEGFKSALSALFSQPTREVTELTLQKSQLELQRLERKRAGATDKELKGLDKQIEALDREIQIRSKQHEIMKLQAELADKTLITEQQLFDQVELLKVAVGTTSSEVVKLNGAVFFQALAAINAANALNLVADAGRLAAGGAGASGNAVGGPAGGGWSWINEGSSGSAELVKLPTGAWVMPASATREMLSGGGGGGVQISISLHVPEDRRKIRAMVMEALDDSLDQAMLQGNLTGSSSYSSRM